MIDSIEDILIIRMWKGHKKRGGTRDAFTNEIQKTIDRSEEADQGSEHTTNGVPGKPGSDKEPEGNHQ